MRVRHLILPCLAACGLAGAPGALASTGGASVGGGTGGASTSSASSASGANTSSTRKAANLNPRASKASGGAGVGTAPAGPSTPTHPTVDGAVAKIIHGVAYAPSQAPLQVQQAIWAGDRIDTLPYVFGGGHGSFKDTGYDCSGSVSFLMHGAGLLATPLASGDFESWGQSGLGQWITVYTNPGHAFVEIAGIRLDTSAEGDPHPAKGSGPRWRPLLHDTSAFRPRHPAGL